MLSTTSPIGVAPPVNDDWAPIGSTARRSGQRQTDVRLARRRHHAFGVAAGKMSRVLEKGREHVRVALDVVRGFPGRHPEAPARESTSLA